MSRSALEFSLSVVGLNEVNHKLLSDVSHLVSLIDPETVLSFNSDHHLILEVHDALDSKEGKQAPVREDALTLCRYADGLDIGKVSHLLVHCHMGRSRSAAAAAILLVRLGHSPSEAFSRIREVRDPIWPNWTLIEHGDDVLGCGGELCRACEIVYKEVRQAHPQWVEDPRPESIHSATVAIWASPGSLSASNRTTHEYNSELDLKLDQNAYLKFGEANVREQLQAFARSTRIAINRDQLSLMLCGTDLGHHDADPYLYEYLNSLPVTVNRKELGGFHVRLPNYDLCLEDSWSGYFVSLCLVALDQLEPLVFIHLDDHTDMMDTLLLPTADGLIDPGPCDVFDPLKPDHWPIAIRSGAVGIGSFVTAIYYSPQPVHVLHLNHVVDSHCQRSAVVRRTVQHPFLPLSRFAGIEKQVLEADDDQLGTYTSGDDAMHLLKAVPQGRVIGHIDLDYFINDYNGNVGSEPDLSVNAMRERASERIEVFFNSLTCSGITVERWIIATSPGFCSARHWEWLLETLNGYIEVFNGRMR